MNLSLALELIIAHLFLGELDPLSTVLSVGKPGPAYQITQYYKCILLSSDCFSIRISHLLPDISNRV